MKFPSCSLVYPLSSKWHMPIFVGLFHVCGFIFILSFPNLCLACLIISNLWSRIVCPSCCPSLIFDLKEEVCRKSMIGAGWGHVLSCRMSCCLLSKKCSEAKNRVPRFSVFWHCMVSLPPSMSYISATYMFIYIYNTSS